MRPAHGDSKGSILRKAKENTARMWRARGESSSRILRKYQDEEREMRRAQHVSENEGYDTKENQKEDKEIADYTKAAETPAATPPQQRQEHISKYEHISK